MRVLKAILRAVFVAAILFVVPATAAAFPADYDGDGKHDLVVWRIESSGVGAFFLYGSDPAYFPQNASGLCPACFQKVSGQCKFDNWGLPGDYAISGDYDGDGKADPTVFRPSIGRWWIAFSSNCEQSVYVDFGLSNDIPDEGDFDQDNRSDLAFLRTTNTPGNPFAKVAKFHHRSSIHPNYAVHITNNLVAYPPNYTPQPDDFAISGQWHLSSVSPPTLHPAAKLETPTFAFPRVGTAHYFSTWNGVYVPGHSITFSGYGDVLENDFSHIIPVFGNVGGSLEADAITYNTQGGAFRVRFTDLSAIDYDVNWGRSYDIPMVADVDGDGVGELTVWRNSWADPSWVGAWFIYEPTSGSCPSHLIQGGSSPLWCYRHWGLPGDTPLK